MKTKNENKNITMKKRAISWIIGLIAASGVGIYNLTGEDVTLPNGEIIETGELTESLTKHYQERNIEDSLYITIHHTAGPKTASLESIAKFHVEMRGWPAIAYHIAINDDGDIYFLNDIEERTYHDSGENTVSIGVVLVGNYEEKQPSDDMIESVKLVTDALCQSLKIKGIRAHRDTSPTLCCGINAYNKLQDIFF